MKIFVVWNSTARCVSAVWSIWFHFWGGITRQALYYWITSSAPRHIFFKYADWRHYLLYGTLTFILVQENLLRFAWQDKIGRNADCICLDCLLDSGKEDVIWYKCYPLLVIFVVLWWSCLVCFVTFLREKKEL